jgi:adenylate cyclase
MNTQAFERKLTAILSADVKEYSRLMSQDERGTIRTLTAYKEAMSNLIQEYKGRVVDAPGDNLLAEFGSVVDAVNCAVEIQRELDERNADLPPARKMEFRIGINLGDVVEKDERIYGDGVNIAARLENLAEPGGICISGTVYDHVKNKLGIEYEYLGEQSVKNIPEPVRVYRVLSFPGAAAHRVIKAKKALTRTWRNLALAISALLVLVVGVWAILNYKFPAAPPPAEMVSKKPPPAKVIEKPSIAVLPFVNMSDDPQQEYFGDGMADDLITDLSKVSGLHVISRHSTFGYKGKSIEVKQIAENLGARYVLEGSVRKVGDQVRINAQLIDAATQHHLWAERFDRPLGDIFAVQDRIARKIVATLAVKLTEREQKDVYRKGTDNVKAYDAFLKGADLMKRYYPARVPKAIAYFEESLKLDPNYSRAYASLSEAYLFAGIYGGRLVDLSPQECFVRSEHYREISMKAPTAGSYGVNAFFLLPVQRRWEEAIADGERCVALAPNESSAWHSLDWALIWGGRPEEAIDVASTSLSVDRGCVYCAYQARGYGKLVLGELEEALNCFERAYEFQPENKIMSLRPLAVTNALLGRTKEARQFIAPYIKMGLSLACLMPPFKDPRSEELWAEGLLKAGLPGEPGGYYKSAIFLEPNLNGKEIKELVFGRTISGFDICGGREWSIERPEEGKATIRRDKITHNGKSWIDGDKICNKWNNLYGGYKDCMRVYVNPEGTKERKDQYIGTTVYGLIPFSVVD